MTQVFDASAVFGALVGRSADGWWCDARLAEDMVAAPALMPFEVANVVRRHEARGALDPTAARRALDDLAGLDVDLVPFDVLAARAWELRANLTVHDASYVALAEILEARLVSLDRRLGHAPGIRCEVLVAPEDDSR